MIKHIVLYYFCCTLAIDGYTDFRLHKNWPKDMEEICGDNSQDRIIGGKFAKLGQYPWLVQLVYKIKDNHGGSDWMSPDCGGSLITKLHVISAGHCIADARGELDHIVIGEYDTNKDPDCDEDGCAKPVQNIKPAEVFMHENYNGKIYKADIIVVKLEHPAELNGWVTPICLPTGTETFDTTSEVAGWGMAKAKDLYSLQTVLNYVKLPILDMDVCRMYIKLKINGKRQICAGSPDRYEDSCGGDSGGPLMQIANSDYGPRYYQTGIVSFGPEQCGLAPAIYTKLLAYMNFVLDKLGV